jgi:hypothetical protein
LELNPDGTIDLLSIDAKTLSLLRRALWSFTPDNLFTRSQDHPTSPAKVAGNPIHPKLSGMGGQAVFEARIHTANGA